jgi:hypothetical protein
MPRRDRDADWDDDDRRRARPRNMLSAKKKQANPILLLALIGGGVGLLIVVGVVVLLVVRSGSGGGLIGGPARDPKFDQVQVGMTEAEVYQLLGELPYISIPGGSVCFTSPRLTLEEFHQNPSRNREIQDVITIYFKDGKVTKTYRQTGEEFRQPRPR